MAKRADDPFFNEAEVIVCQVKLKDLPGQICVGCKSKITPEDVYGASVMDLPSETIENLLLWPKCCKCLKKK